MNTYLASVARHLLTGLGGGLLAIGIGQTEVTNFTSAATPIIAGVISYGIGQALSFLSKRKL